MLTERERDVLALIGCGYGVEDVAEEMGISGYSLRDKVKSIRAKLGLPPSDVLFADLPEKARELGVTVPACDDDEE